MLLAWCSTKAKASGRRTTMARGDAHTATNVRKRGRRQARFDLIRFLSLSAGLSALLTCSAWGAKWEIVPTLSVVETYTDNVSLVSDAAKQSDWVTQVIPAISIVATGDRLRFNASYRPELTYHAQ